MIDLLRGRSEVGHSRKKLLDCTSGVNCELIVSWLLEYFQVQWRMSRKMSRKMSMRYQQRWEE